MHEDLGQLISRAMLRDQSGFLRRWEAVRRHATGSGAGGGSRFVGEAELRRQVEESVRRRDVRLRERPAIWYPPDLPVTGKLDELRAVIEANQVVVVCGETGSGKTTQLPKLCLEMGRGVGALIGHTQPRRIAARSVAARLAEELNSRVGEYVGFKIRFSDSVSERTYIKVMTDGILLAETQGASASGALAGAGGGDRLLQQYDTIILDEAHERSLNIDFLLGYLKQLLPRRPELKLIITSATIEPEKFSRHFDGCPIVMVSGRMYPVEVRYRDPHAAEAVQVEEDGSRVVEKEIDEEEPDLMQAVVRGVEEAVAAGPGDVLVFLSGEREIREAARELEGALGPRAEILPLFARLSMEEQQRVFLPPVNKRRRIVLATNVAETSLTVPGIRYVVDSGLARISRYAPRSKSGGGGAGGGGGGVQRLPIEAISQASANQRSGRCGRVAAGICIRLYSEENFRERPAFSEPEILRTNLAAVILRMKALKLGAIEEFPFMQQPNARLIADGYQTLWELGAITKPAGGGGSAGGEAALTLLGEKLARLPLDPRIARMVLAGQAEGVEQDVLIIAAALSVQDPRERPLEKQEAADAAHLEFRDADSDFLSYLKLWEWYQREARAGSGSRVRKVCRDRFLSYTRMREWQDVHEQLSEALGELREEERAAPPLRSPGTAAQAPAGALGKLPNIPRRRIPTGESSRPAPKP